MRSTVSKLSTLAPVIFMISGCENEGRQTVAEQKSHSKSDPFAPKTAEITTASQPTKEPCCIEISTKFVEITSGTEELGFDWIVEPFGTDNASPETSEKESSPEN